MTTTLTDLTRRIDDEFTHTWYEIRPQAIDNILDRNVAWAALRERGCFVPQRGGLYIERTLRYGKKTATAIDKGDTLPTGEDDIETAALWTWRYLASHIQRSLIDDQKNSGKFRIKQLVTTKINAAKEALEEHYDDELFSAPTYASTAQTETGKEIQSLFDIFAKSAALTTLTSGTYGKVAWNQTGPVNLWWTPSATTVTGDTGPKYLALTAPVEVNLLSQMKQMYNYVSQGMYPPDLILTDQTLFEYFEEFALDMSQIIINEGTRLAKLGFEVLKFKGADLVWSDKMLTTYSNMMFLNTKFIEVVYDPGMWFDMTGWKEIYNQHERIAHITCALNVITAQRRRHGLLYATA